MSCWAASHLISHATISNKYKKLTSSEDREPVNSTEPNTMYFSFSEVWNNLVWCICWGFFVVGWFERKQSYGTKIIEHEHDHEMHARLMRSVRTSDRTVFTSNSCVMVCVYRCWSWRLMDTRCNQIKHGSKLWTSLEHTHTHTHIYTTMDRHLTQWMLIIVAVNYIHIREHEHNTFCGK